MVDLAARAAATQRVVDRFRRRPFDWATRATCIHLARAQMRALGHRPPAIPDFRSPTGARRALAATGHPSLGALLDAMLPRIAPLEMIVGDLALVPGEAPFDALGVAAGDGTLLMYHEAADGLANVTGAVGAAIGAWRV